MSHQHAHVSAEHQAESDDRVMFGFWIYLMTDLLMFAVLFACFAVLRNSTGGGEAVGNLLSPHLAFVETLILLTSSFTCGIGMIAARKRQLSTTYLWFIVTFILGLSFLCIELWEFRELIHEGFTMRTNASFSSFFVLVGTHGLHITSGLVWLGIIFYYLKKRGLNNHMVRKLALVSLFWHFLDIVWIFIFTVVYLISKI